MLRCDNEKLAVTRTKKGLATRLAKFYGEKDNEQQPDGRGKRKRTDNLGKQVKNSQQRKVKRKTYGSKRKMTDNLSRNKILGDRKGHRLDEMDSEEEFVDGWGDEDGMDFIVSPVSECSRDSGEGDVEVDSPGDTSTDQATGGSSSEGDVSDRGEAIGEEEEGSDDDIMEGYTDAGPGPSRKHWQVRGRERGGGTTHTGSGTTHMGDWTPHIGDGILADTRFSCFRWNAASGCVDASCKFPHICCVCEGGEGTQQLHAPQEQSVRCPFPQLCKTV